MPALWPRDERKSGRLAQCRSLRELRAHVDQRGGAKRQRDGGGEHSTRPPVSKGFFASPGDPSSTTPPSNANTDPTLAAPGIKPITRFDFLAPGKDRTNWAGWRTTKSCDCWAREGWGSFSRRWTRACNAPSP